MDSEWLFLKRMDQIALSATSCPECRRGDMRDQLMLLDLAALLRKVLFDQKSLADTVNVNKLPLRFRVRKLGLVQPGQFRILVGVDHTDDAAAHEVAELTRGQFGQHVMADLAGVKVTVRDIVRFAANVAGGVHFDPAPTAKHSAAKTLYEAATADDVPVLLVSIISIAIVALNGLQPLYLDVQRRVAARSP